MWFLLDKFCKSMAKWLNCLALDCELQSLISIMRSCVLTTANYCPYCWFHAPVYSVSPQVRFIHMVHHFIGKKFNRSGGYTK